MDQNSVLFIGLPIAFGCIGWMLYGIYSLRKMRREMKARTFIYVPDDDSTL
jgi:hypothetical protein